MPFEVEVVSAHRTPQKMFDFAEAAADRGIRVIIAGAGGAAHLPGMVASMTHLPVIGVPVNVTALSGLDAVMSILQMPLGVPVATMAVDNSGNAALFAARILASSGEKKDSALAARLLAMQKQQRNKVKAANRSLQAKVKSLKAKK